MTAVAVVVRSLSFVASVTQRAWKQPQPQPQHTVFAVPSTVRANHVQPAWRHTGHASEQVFADPSSRLEATSLQQTSVRVSVPGPP